MSSTSARSRRTSTSASPETSSTTNVVKRAAPAGFVTGRMIRDALELTMSTFRSLYARGVIKSVRRDSRGGFLYPENTIEELKAYLHETSQQNAPTGKLLPATRDPVVPYSMEECTAVFERLQQGESPVTISLATKIHPAVMNVIVKDYARLSGSMWVTKETVDALNRMTKLPSLPIESGADLVANFEELIEMHARATKCMTCRKSARPDECSGCQTKAQSANTNGAPRPKRATQPAASGVAAP